jgi:hypothetical protein
MRHFCENDVLLPQDVSHQVPIHLGEVFSHPFSSIIDDPRGIKIRSKMNKIITHYEFISQLEPKIFKDANNCSN